MSALFTASVYCAIGIVHRLAGVFAATTVLAGTAPPSEPSRDCGWTGPTWRATRWSACCASWSFGPSGIAAIARRSESSEAATWTSRCTVIIDQTALADIGGTSTSKKTP